MSQTPATLLELSRELHAVAQAGLAYSDNPYDRERYARVQQIAGKLVRGGYGLDSFEWPASVGYLTPKVDVRGLVFKGDEVLLVREASSRRWAAPGGWADVNLTPAENVEKEIREEAGCICRATRLVSIIDRHRAGYPQHPECIYKLFFLCELISGEPRAELETTEAGFFPLAALPELDRGRVSEEDIRRGFQHAGDPAMPTYFH
jgi:ADP-ribose pyrophosphatase YjhB (NUDIX family)